VLYSATDIFAFQGSQLRQRRNNSTPDYITQWRTLKPNSLAASIDSLDHNRYIDQNGEIAEEPDDTSNEESILVACDDRSRIHFVLDGTYPVGFVTLENNVLVSSIYKHPSKPLFFVHQVQSLDGQSLTDFLPISLALPLLDSRSVRDFARLSTTARDLGWYLMRHVSDMNDVWIGSGSHPGANEIGPKWLTSFEKKQREEFGRQYMILSCSYIHSSDL
jgi:anaphase-promoting complex subunit 4